MGFASLIISALLSIGVGWFGGILAGVAVAIVCAIVLLAVSLKTVRPTEKGLIERFGKFNRYAEAGLTFLVPFTERLIIVNTTQTMVEVDRKEMITKDTLNAQLKPQIYYKIKQDSESVKASQYNVNNVHYQIEQLATSTLRNIIGGMTFTDTNSKRSVLNDALAKELKDETSDWGIEILRAELMEITPPADVQQTMNNVINAEKTKTAASDLAEAHVLEADGQKEG